MKNFDNAPFLLIWELTQARDHGLRVLPRLRD